MESPKPQPGRNREITYRVGWKTGKIQVDGQGRPLAEAGKPASVRLMRRMMELALKEAPFIPGKAVVPLLWALPAVGFGTTWLLVYALSQGQ